MPAIDAIFELFKNPDKISRHIQTNLSVRTSEKNKYGEVFTPLEYITRLLDQLPSHVWSNPALRWLEPAAGIGNFCVVVYIRLMEGLSTVITDEMTRHKHIIQNMICMVEINKDNVERSRDLFGPMANIRCADFLSKLIIAMNLFLDQDQDQGRISLLVIRHFKHREILRGIVVKEDKSYGISSF
jgi:hypothetical protein